LADTSAWVVSQRAKALSGPRERFSRLLLAGELATCGAVCWELLHNSRNGPEYQSRRADLTALHRASFDDVDWEQALDICQELAVRGGALHRAPSIADVVVAVAAERADLTVLHYDKDFDLIAGVTGQPCEWIAPKGSL
jgi:hypothetical protein